MDYSGVLDVNINTLKILLHTKLSDMKFTVQ